MAADLKTDASLPPEIAKYSAILSKDPNSMVFAPLAEAYRKAGMLDEAIRTAEDGLKRHPNYPSAMVVLGRAYYDKGMLKEAEEEMGKVVSMAPDNLIAKSILKEIKKQWPVVSGPGPEAEIEAKAGEVKIEEGAEEAVPQLGGAAPAGMEEISEAPEGLEPEAEPEEPELVELEEVPEVEELEAEEEAGAAFGEEITNELWTGESFTEAPEGGEEAKPRKEITTETIAELYIKQGYIDRAIDVYQMLYEAHPEDEEIKRKLEELKKQVPEARGQVLEKLEPEDENVKRLKAWLDMVRKERRKG